MKFHWMDGVSIGTIAAVIVGWLPHVATALAIVWYGVLFYDRYKAKKQDSKSGDDKAV